MMGIPDTGTEEVAKRPKGPIRHPRRIDAIQVLSYGLREKSRIFVCWDWGRKHREWNSGGRKHFFSFFFSFFSFGRGINSLEHPLYIYCFDTLNNPTKNRAVNFLIFIEL